MLAAVQARLLAAHPAPPARASVTFLGVERIEVLRFALPDGVRYVTLGMSRHPMSDPRAVVVDPAAPRAEVVLALPAPQDDVLHALAVVAATPVVEGLVLAPGVVLRLDSPLWTGSAATAVRVGDPAELPDLADGVPAGPDHGPVSFLPLEPHRD